LKQCNFTAVVNPITGDMFKGSMEYQIQITGKKDVKYEDYFKVLSAGKKDGTNEYYFTLQIQRDLPKDDQIEVELLANAMVNNNPIGIGKFGFTVTTTPLIPAIINVRNNNEQGNYYDISADYYNKGVDEILTLDTFTADVTYTSEVNESPYTME